MGALFDAFEKMQKGMTPEQIRKEEIKEGKERVKVDPKGKRWGKCDSCYYTTVVEKDTGLCGPCCFGESETYNGNW